MSKTSDYKTWLTKAKEILGQRGWTRGRLEKDSGKVCALGALYYASACHTVPATEVSSRSYSKALEYNHPKLYEALVQAADEGTRHKCGVGVPMLASPVPFFNDEVARSPKDVQKLFDAAICYLEKSE